MKNVKQLIDLSGRRAVVTGGSGFLGATFGDALAEIGANIVLVDIDEAKLNKSAQDIMSRWGVSVEIITCDLELESERNELIQYLHSLPSVDILVNNAAFAGTSNLEGWVVPFEEQTVDTWKRAIEVNLTAVFDLCKGCAPLLKAGMGGSIINISSIYGLSAPDYRLYEGTQMGNPAAYSASKGGLLQLTRWLSTTLAPNVRVNSISPGGVFREQPQEFVQRYVSRTPSGRMATEEDFKGAIVYLASDLSSYMTGQNLIVDGGWTVW
ncbi:MAG: SDR family oxidoreductase [Gammaproteobacteria bacterium]|nr:SDR family oxidoreductase [Gammaproteobacteria bacterium]